VRFQHLMLYKELVAGWYVEETVLSVPAPLQGSRRVYIAEKEQILELKWFCARVYGEILLDSRR
jgi:hypothetical protein